MRAFPCDCILSRWKCNILRFPSRAISLQRIDAWWLTVAFSRILSPLLQPYFLLFEARPSLLPGRNLGDVSDDRARDPQF